MYTTRSSEGTAYTQNPPAPNVKNTSFGAPNTCPSACEGFWQGTIDYLLAVRPSQGQPQCGIYTFDGHMLRINMAVPGFPRPTTFEPGPKRTITTWSRTQIG